MMNILFLVIDSLRYDATLGEWHTNTPNLDHLAEDGISFTNCFSQGISTAPAMAAMLTGRLPLDYGGHWHLDGDQSTFAEAFANHDYHTGAIHSNPYVSARRNFDRGFEHFEEDIVAFEPDRGLEGAPEKLLRLVSRASRIFSRTPYTPAETVNEKMLGFVDSVDEPWFLWTQYMDVHGPYLGGDDFSYRNKFRAEWLWRKAAVRDPNSITEAEDAEIRRKYELEVEYVDYAIGEFLDELETRNILEDTMVVLTADHGDEFYEHGRYGHGNLPYDELTHVPLIIRPPDTMEFPRGISVEEIVRCIDILPTVLDVVGAKIPKKHRERLAGESLQPLIQGGGRDKIPTVITEKRVRGEEALRIGFRTERWKYLYDGVEDQAYLYDLDSDPKESVDVSGTRDDVAGEFEERLRARFERIDKTSANVTIPDMEADVAVEERLRALGYRD